MIWIAERTKALVLGPWLPNASHISFRKAGSSNCTFMFQSYDGVACGSQLLSSRTLPSDRCCRHCLLEGFEDFQRRFPAREVGRRSDADYAATQPHNAAAPWPNNAPRVHHPDGSADYQVSLISPIAKRALVATRTLSRRPLSAWPRISSESPAE